MYDPMKSPDTPVPWTPVPCQAFTLKTRLVRTEIK